MARLVVNQPPGERLPIALYLPNLIGYVRVIALLVALAEKDSGSHRALWAMVISLGLDYIDGPCARRFGMCTQFGDLLDHYTDHVTMFWLVYITSAWKVNIAVNALHAVVACGYMALYGHYFKHSAGGNMVTRIVEENNYFNMPSMLWNANTVLIPFVKLSYHIERGLPRTGSTALVDVCDGTGLGCRETPNAQPHFAGVRWYPSRSVRSEPPARQTPPTRPTLNALSGLGLVVTLAYTVAVCLPSDGRKSKGNAS